MTELRHVIAGAIGPANTDNLLERLAHFGYRIVSDTALADAEREGQTELLSVIADIRDKSGVGDKPMLGELADAIAARIAAAPDMYEALKFIVAEQPYAATQEWRDRLEAAREKVYAAIAKAEGRTVEASE